MKKTVSTFKENKEQGKKISMVTAYDYTTARLLDSCDIDGILVGDTLGMICLGYQDTLRVTMEDMIHHSKAVSRGTNNALLVTDMPFMSYQLSVYDAVKNAGRLMQEGYAEAVKLEGCHEVLPQIKAIVSAQIPVMGHIGLTPQSIKVFGGFKVQGKDITKAKELIEDAKRLEDAGVFSIVLECIPLELAAKISEAVTVPTIGIGAGKGCDGQVLVFHDMCGMYAEFKPKFVKIFSNAGETIKESINRYKKEVSEGIFPDDEHSYHMPEEIINKL